SSSLESLSDKVSNPRAIAWAVCCSSSVMGSLQKMALLEPSASLIPLAIIAVLHVTGHDDYVTPTSRRIAHIGIIGGNKGRSVRTLPHAPTGNPRNGRRCGGRVRLQITPNNPLPRGELPALIQTI